MKRIMYVLGMVFALCCCSSNGDKASSDAINDNGSNVNYLYSYYDFRQEDPGCDIYGFCSKEDFGNNLTLQLIAYTSYADDSHLRVILQTTAQTRYKNIQTAQIVERIVAPQFA